MSSMDSGNKPTYQDFSGSRAIIHEFELHLFLKLLSSCPTLSPCIPDGASLTTTCQKSPRGQYSPCTESKKRPFSMIKENKSSVLSSNDILDIALEDFYRCSLNPDNRPTRKPLMPFLFHRQGTWDMTLSIQDTWDNPALRSRHNFLLNLCSPQWLVLGSVVPNF